MLYDPLTLSQLARVSKMMVGGLDVDDEQKDFLSDRLLLAKGVCDGGLFMFCSMVIQLRRRLYISRTFHLTYFPKLFPPMRR